MATTITKEEFQAYEKVRLSGVTNMFDTRRVERLSGLDKSQMLKIMADYSELDTLYSGVTHLKKRK